MPRDLLGPTLEDVQMWLRSASGWVPAGFVLNVEPVNARLGRVLVVEDDPGIATQLARGLTRAGYETGSNPNGTGLGLAIVQRLVTSNGRTAQPNETPGGGLTAVLESPACQHRTTQRRTTRGRITRARSTLRPRRTSRACSRSAGSGGTTPEPPRRRSLV